MSGPAVLWLLDRKIHLDEKPANEMVRRLILCERRLIVEAASDKEDHRHADTFSWHRSGQDDFSSRGTRRGGQVARPEQVHSPAAAGIHPEHARPAGPPWRPMRVLTVS